MQEAEKTATKASVDEMSARTYDQKTADELVSAGETSVQADKNKANAIAARVTAEGELAKGGVGKVKAPAARKALSAARLVEAAALTAADAADAAWSAMRDLKVATSACATARTCLAKAATSLVTAEKAVVDALGAEFTQEDQAATAALEKAVELRNSALATSQAMRTRVEQEALAVESLASVSAKKREVAITAHGRWNKTVSDLKKKAKKRRSGGGGGRGRRSSKAAPADAVAMSPEDWRRWSPKKSPKTMERDSRFCVKKSTISGAGEGLFSARRLEKNTEIELIYTPKIASEVTSKMRAEFTGMIIDTGLNVNLEASEVRPGLPELSNRTKN
jgi:hypothetical protein